MLSCSLRIRFRKGYQIGDWLECKPSPFFGVQWVFAGGTMYNSSKMLACYGEETVLRLTKFHNKLLHLLRSLGRRRTRDAVPAPSKVLVPKPIPWLYGSEESSLRVEAVPKEANDSAKLGLAFAARLSRAVWVAAAAEGLKEGWTPEKGTEKRMCNVGWSSTSFFVFFFFGFSGARVETD